MAERTGRNPTVTCRKSYDHVYLPAISLFSDNKPKTTELLLNRITRGTQVVVRILGIIIFSSGLLRLSSLPCQLSLHTSNNLLVLALSLPIGPVS